MEEEKAQQNEQEEEKEEEGLKIIDDQDGNMEIEETEGTESKSKKVILTMNFNNIQKGAKVSQPKGLSNEEFVSLGDDGLKSDESIYK